MASWGATRPTRPPMPLESVCEGVSVCVRECECAFVCLCARERERERESERSRERERERARDRKRDREREKEGRGEERKRAMASWGATRPTRPPMPLHTQRTSGLSRHLVRNSTPKALEYLRWPSRPLVVFLWERNETTQRTTQGFLEQPLSRSSIGPTVGNTVGTYGRFYGYSTVS